MTPPNPDPTGVRRLLKAIEKAPNACGCPQCKELDAAKAAVRVSELERVVELVKDADLRHDQDCPCIFNLEICTCHVKPIRQSLAALDACRKCGGTGMLAVAPHDGGAGYDRCPDCSALDAKETT